MLTKLDIKNFGSFQNFAWQSCVDSGDKKSLTFKDLNIIYGRNYSGKTTLSRLVRSLGSGSLPPNYTNPEFTIIRSDGSSYTTHNHSDYPDDVRVFNRDYINDYLGFLIDESRDIKPFTVLGKENTEITEKIKKLQVAIEGTDGTGGLNAEHEKLQGNLKACSLDHGAHTTSLEELYTDKARSIKNETLLNVVTYNARPLKKDLEAVANMGITPLAAEDELELRNTLKEDPLGEFKAQLPATIESDELFEGCASLLQQEVTANEQIQRLAANAALNDWVSRGMPLHQKGDSCGFCGQTLPSGLWDELDAHFSEEVKSLEKNLDQTIATVDDSLELFSTRTPISEKDFLPKYRPAVAAHNEDINSWALKYTEDLKNYKKALLKRRQATLNPTSPPNFSATTDSLNLITTSFQETIDKNNAEIGEQDRHRADQRKKLRRSIVAQFQIDAGIVEKKKKIEDLAGNQERAKEEFNKVSRHIAKTRSELQALGTQLTNEATAAERVNEYLGHHFGCQSIRLECDSDPDAEEPEYQFNLYRGDDPAYNLSEGECSLVAFCYFIARLEAAGTSGKDIIIFIDDPISSLDDNHIFFMFSLIESVIAKPMQLAIKDTSQKCSYKQMFISTHNLDFLRYLKRLSINKKTKRQAFLIEQTSASSQMIVMPRHLEAYATEFIYLFDQICECCSEKDQNTRIHFFNSFGNNLRRFLEIYLFFKYPSTTDHSDEGVTGRITEFFDATETDSPLVQRIINEFSHTVGRVDRAMRPTDVPELAKLARFVLEKMKSADPKQYSYLLESCDKLDPIAT